MIDLSKAKVLVTGSDGFLGKHVLDVLEKEYNCFAYECSRRSWDLTVLNDARDAIHDQPGFDYVIHLAGYNGGIAFNDAFPADIFTRNTMMALNVLQASREYEVKKVLSVVASCAYPDRIFHRIIEDNGCRTWQTKDIDYDYLEEEDFLGEPPHPGVACHGYAKRNLQLASSFYHKQYGLNAVCACPTTLYGPGDSFDSERTKLMGGMVKRFVDAVEEGRQDVVCWGSGSPLREFLYVTDAARLLVETLLHYDNSELPLNLGTGQEISVKDLAEKVAGVVGYTGKISWDTSRPDGQYRKRLDLTRMHEVLPRIRISSFDEGIAQTVSYYKNEARHRPQ